MIPTSLMNTSCPSINFRTSSLYVPSSCLTNRRRLLPNTSQSNFETISISLEIQNWLGSANKASIFIHRHSISFINPQIRINGPRFMMVRRDEPIMFSASGNGMTGVCGVVVWVQVWSCFCVWIKWFYLWQFLDDKLDTFISKWKIESTEFGWMVEHDKNWIQTNSSKTSTFTTGSQFWVLSNQ